MKKTVSKKINIPCQCAGGSRECGFLQVFRFNDDEFEFCWVKKKTTEKPKVGIYVFGKELAKLRKFLFLLK